MFKTFFSSALLLSIYLFFTGCSIHTINENPQDNLEIPKGYSFSSETLGDHNISIFWHEAFSDKRLSSLISYAYEHNYDINQSIARIKAAMAISKFSNASRYPELFLEASSTQQLMSDENQNTSKAGLTLTWELDLFNKLENISKSDVLEFEALQEELEALKLSLGSEIAIAYFGALSEHQTLQLLQQQVELNEHYLELINLRFEQGVATNLEILQQKGQVAQSRSLIPPAFARLRAYENRLDVLLGEVPDGKARVNKEATILDVVMPSNTGLPSDLLLFRPDLRAQLKRLIAADADIAVAIAERLPSLTLGAGGYYSHTNSYSGFLGGLSASLLQPLIDWGARKAEVEHNKALYEEQLAIFSSLYLQALEEVETAIYNEKQQVEYLKRLENRRDILEKTVKEAELQYLQGVSDYLPVLNALVSLHTLERSLISAKYDLILYRITLHRSLGSKAKINKENI